MAIAATIVWEARTTATAGNVNGGGFKTGASGTDYSQQDAAQYNLTGVTTAGADAVLLSASAAADMVGNLAHIVSGTNFTAGWYEIISVTVGVSITLDRTCATAAGALGVVNIGGALSLAASDDDAVFESMEAGNIMHIKAGSYTMGGAVSMLKDGTSLAPISIRGYNASRNDAPTGANRPTLAFGANVSQFGDYVNLEDIIFTTTDTAGLQVSLGASATNCKITQSSGTAGRRGVSLTSGNLLGCEISATNGAGVFGKAVLIVGSDSKIRGCNLHDSDYGIDVGTLDSCDISDNIIDTMVTRGISLGSNSNFHTIAGNTLYGAATPAGSSKGIDFLATAGARCIVINNIISGWVTGIDSAAAVGSNIFRYNTLNNNTTNYGANVTAGTGSDTVDPGFTDAPNGNFTVGANVKATAFPGVFPGELSTGYLDRGAVQRQEPVGGGASGGARVMGTGIVSGG